MPLPDDTRPAADLAPVLEALLRRDGIALLDRRGRLNGLLRDYAPGAIRDIHLLLDALDAGTPARLAAAPDPAAPDALAAEADLIAARSGADPALALGAVQSWGRALAAIRAPDAPAPSSPTLRPLAGGEDPGEAPGGFGRWGGIALALFLVLVALARWVGWI